MRLTEVAWGTPASAVFLAVTPSPLGAPCTMHCMATYKSDTLLVEERLKDVLAPSHDWQFRVEALLTRIVDALETRGDREARELAIERWMRGEGKHPDD